MTLNFQLDRSRLCFRRRNCRFLPAHSSTVRCPGFLSLHSSTARHTGFLFSFLCFSLCIAVCFSEQVYAYDAEKIERYGLVRGDLSTWTQRGDSFPQNKLLSVDGDSPLSTMGCSFYATFFMLCRMGIKSPLTDTAWQFAVECKKRNLLRERTGYFDPRSISKVTGGRVQFVEEGNYPDYYGGLAAVGNCDSPEDMYSLIRQLTLQKGWFLVACVVGDVTNYENLEYYSEGHYIFIDSVLGNGDFLIGDSAFPGTRWSDNWGAHGASIVKLYAYKLLDENGKQVMPSERQSMYIIRSEDED